MHPGTRGLDLVYIYTRIFARASRVLDSLMAEDFGDYRATNYPAAIVKQVDEPCTVADLSLINTHRRTQTHTHTHTIFSARMLTSLDLSPFPAPGCSHP